MCGVTCCLRGRGGRGREGKGAGKSAGGCRRGSSSGPLPLISTFLLLLFLPSFSRVFLSVCLSLSLFHASMNLSRNERTPTADSLGHRLCPVHEREANCPSSLCGRGSAPLYSQGRLLLWCQRRVIGRGRVTSRKLIGWNDRVTIPPLPLAIGYLSVPFSSFTLRNRSLRPQRCSLMAARYWPSLSRGQAE